MLILSGCGNNNNSDSKDNSAKGSTDGKIDTSKEVKLNAYLLGEAPKGMQDVVDELNKRLKKDINATIKFNYIGWGDLQSKYPLVLASGEPVDLIYTADWAYYAQEASKGAFKEINEKMLKTYMPKHYAATSQDIWKGTKLDGKMYMIPTSTPDRKVEMVLIRKDLREKYGVPEIKKFSDIEPYLAAIKKNNPEMVPLNLDSQYDLPTPFLDLYREKYAYLGLTQQDPSYIGFGYQATDTSGKLTYQLEGDSLAASKEAASVMKDWYSKGYLNKNPYANKVRSKDNFVEGKSGVAFGNSQDLQSTIDSAKAKGYDVEMIPVFWPSGQYGLANPQNNGMAIGANSDHAERAMMALDLIMEDPAYDYLVYFGIEGKNYVITDDGKVGLPEGVTSETNTYPPDAAGFWFTNKDVFKPMASWSQEYADLKASLKDKLITPVYSSLTFNSENVKTQSANVANVSTQYAYPIYIGAVKNVDKAFDTLIDKLQKAGINDIKKELQKQADAYMQNMGK